MTEETKSAEMKRKVRWKVAVSGLEVIYRKNRKQSCYYKFCSNVLKYSLFMQASKPIMEKKRRARINDSLQELKVLILEASKKDVSTEVGSVART